MPGPLLLAVLALTVDQQPAPVIIPRYRDTLPATEARGIWPNSYDPQDFVLAWTETGNLLVSHGEFYRAYDMGTTTCAGSGVYAVTVADGSARPVAIGAPACQAALTDHGAVADPAGRWVVYTRLPSTHASAFLRLTLSTTAVDTVPIDCHGEVNWPAVSRDGEFIALEGYCDPGDAEGSRIYLVRVDGTGLRPVSSAHRGTYDQMPSWSPDGTRVAFEVEHGDLPRAREVAVQDTSGKNRRVVTHGWAPAWSPDGNWIAFLSPDRRTLRVIRPDGAGERVLLRGRESVSGERVDVPWFPLVWSPDSRWLAFTRVRRSGSSVWRVEVASGRALQVTAPDAR